VVPDIEVHKDGVQCEDADTIFWRCVPDHPLYILARLVRGGGGPVQGSLAGRALLARAQLDDSIAIIKEPESMPPEVTVLLRSAVAPTVK
jgi:hypothetical protein